MCWMRTSRRRDPKCRPCRYVQQSGMITSLDLDPEARERAFFGSDRSELHSSMGKDPRKTKHNGYLVSRF